MTRRQVLAALLPRVIASEDSGDPISLAKIYAAVERDRPDLVDDEVEPLTGAIRWKHELRWEMETLVVNGSIKRRKDLGEAIYSI